MNAVVKQQFEVPPEGSELTHAARRKIDDDIGELMRRIQVLRMKRNRLSPIFVLPPEVLSNIFILARNSSIDTRNHHARWICIGHVCHHWREVALSSPSLWSVPVFTQPDLAREMLQRSKMAPLIIRSIASTWTPRMLEQLENALVQIPRIQYIELTLRNLPQKINTIFSSFSQPAPLLENLSLSGPASSNQLSFPLDALNDAPRLRSIEFHRVNFSWESAIFKHRNLTELRLKSDYAAMGGTLTMGQMMDALHHLTNLRILALNHSIPSHTTSNGNEKTLTFKFIEQLELVTKAVDCIFLLRHIQYPSHTTVRLYSSSTSVEDSITIFSLLGQNLLRTQSIKTGIHHSPIAIKSLRLSSPDLYTVEAAFFSTTDNMENPITRIRLVGGCTVTQAHARLLTGICDYFNLSSLINLFLDWSFTDDHIRTIRDSFEKLLNLKIISVSQSLPEICLAITGGLEDGRPKNNQISDPPQRGTSEHPLPSVTIFPALRIFIVQNMDFRSSHHSENMEYLTDMLVKRSNINATIHRLSLIFCSGVRTWKKRRLGALVVDLEVDGQVVDVTELSSNDGRSDEDDFSDEDEENEYSDDDGPHYLDGLGGSLF